MKWFFSTLPWNVIDCFRGRMLLWHGLAIVLTFGLVVSGFDWHYFLATRHPVLIAWMFHAAELGMFLPVILPLALILMGYVMANVRVSSIGWAIGQAELIGSFISSTYKAFTGRVHPAHLGTNGPDISEVFRFGFLRGGVFWGWPSSHTTIAFAMAVTIYKIFPKKRWLGLIAIIYAIYIGVGVSMTIHWFSDFVAGAIIGTVIGTVVGKNFMINRENKNGASEGI